MEDLMPVLRQAWKLIIALQDALGTEETGEALVEVARNAHIAEMELAKILQNNDPPGSILDD